MSRPGRSFSPFTHFRDFGDGLVPGNSLPFRFFLRLFLLILLLAGDGIEIVEPDGLMVNVLPKYFRQGKLCSFVRQLNLYGFEKQKDKWEFKHQEGLFVRGGSEKLVYITRRAQSKKKRDDVDDEEHMAELTHHADKKREIVPSTPAGFDSISLDQSVVQHVPAESLQTYEERQSTQEAAIHYLMEAMHQQKQEMTMLRNQVTMLSQYVLSGSSTPSPNLLKTIAPQQQLQQPLRPLSASRTPPQVPSQNLLAQQQPPQQFKEDPFRRHQALGHSAAALRLNDQHSPSTDSSDFSQGRPSPRPFPRNSGSAPMYSPNPMESISTEFNTVTLDEPFNQGNMFNSGDQFMLAQSDSNHMWMQ